MDAIGVSLTLSEELDIITKENLSRYLQRPLASKMLSSSSKLPFPPKEIEVACMIQLQSFGYSR